MSKKLLDDALAAIRALSEELEGYASGHGADEYDEHALALARNVLDRAAKVKRDNGKKVKP